MVRTIHPPPFPPCAPRLSLSAFNYSLERPRQICNCDDKWREVTGAASSTDDCPFFPSRSGIKAWLWPLHLSGPLRLFFDIFSFFFHLNICKTLRLRKVTIKNFLIQKTYIISVKFSKNFFKIKKKLFFFFLHTNISKQVLQFNIFLFLFESDRKSHFQVGRGCLIMQSSFYWIWYG